MRVDHGLLQWRYDQRPQPGMGLGRHLELDPRSLRFLPSPELLGQPIKPVEWDVPLPILDQGNLGACVGFTGTEHIAQLYGAADLAQVSLNGHTLTGDPDNDGMFAQEVYHRCTVADGFPGDWPPEDTGSSGLAACKVLKSARLASGYVWATNRRAFGALLQRSSVMVGMPWFSAWFEPSSEGAFIDNGDWQSSGVAGGHEVLAEALEAWDDNDPSKCIVRFRNHWRPTWGDAGRFRIRLSTYETIKGSVDIKACRRAMVTDPNVPGPGV